jgi:hypothetical protein
VGIGAKVRWVNVRARAGQKDAVDNIQQCPDIRKIGRASKHYRHRAGNLRQCAKTFFANSLRCEAAINLMH